MWVGIDPGATGGVAVLSKDRAEAIPMPTVAGEIWILEIARLLKELSPGLVVLEKAQPMRKGGRVQGVTSAFTYGMGFGAIRGMLETLEIPHRLVTPQAWKKVVLAGTAKDKDAAINFVRRAYPAIDLTPGRKRVPHDGMADAVCIAEYGRVTL